MSKREADEEDEGAAAAADAPAGARKRSVAEAVGDETELLCEAKRRRTPAAAAGRGLGTCTQCGEREARYVCPRCGASTCGLECVKRHKAGGKCDGLRERSKFVPVSAFTDGQLHEDYFFLEEVGRHVDRSKRDAAVRRGAQQKQHQQQARLPKRLALLQKRCAEGGTAVEFMPQGMRRRDENRSTFRIKEGRVAWTVGWSFHGEPGAGPILAHNVPDTLTWREALGAVLEPTPEKAVLRQRLRAYCRAAPGDLRLFMAVPRRPANSARHYSLPLDGVVRESLAGKALIEYPSVVVALAGDEAATYTVLEEGEGASD